MSTVFTNQINILLVFYSYIPEAKVTAIIAKLIKVNISASKYYSLYI